MTQLSVNSDSEMKGIIVPLDGDDGGAVGSVLMPDITPSKSEGMQSLERELEETLETVRRCHEEIQTLQDEKRTLVEEMRITATKDAIVRRSLLMYQGMLVQFSDPSVRATFLDGHLVRSPCSRDVLASLDVFRRLLLPAPSDSRMSLENRMVIIGSLFSRDSSEPTDENLRYLPLRRSYKWWRDYFEVVLYSEGWRTESVHEEITCEDEIVPVGEVVKRKEVRSVRPKEKVVYSNCSDGESSRPADMKDRSFPVNPDSFSSSESVLQETSLIRALKEMGHRREVIPPSVFNPNKGCSIHRFLSTYERYFESRYDGTEVEKSAHLERFLGGATKSAYRALGGTNSDYGRLKQKLVSWYESQQVDSRDKLRDDFLGAVMNQDDTCAIFCMRLEQLAQQVFKESPQEMEHQLKRKLRGSAPPPLVQQIDTAESIFSITDDGSLSWKRLKKLAEQYDRKQVSVDLVPVVSDSLSLFSNRKLRYDHSPDRGGMYDDSWRPPPARSPDHQRRGRTVFWSTDRPSTPPEYVNGQDRMQSRGAPERQDRSKLHCRNCEKIGHSERNCWRRQNRCFVCGSDEHWRVNCPIKSGQRDNGGRQSGGSNEWYSGQRNLNYHALPRVDREQSP